MDIGEAGRKYNEVEKRFLKARNQCKKMAEEVEMLVEWLTAMAVAGPDTTTAELNVENAKVVSLEEVANMVAEFEESARDLRELQKKLRQAGIPVGRLEQP